MTQDEAARRQSLRRIGAVWDQGWTHARVDAYAEALRPYPPAIVERACINTVATCSNRPTPHDVITECKRLQAAIRSWERLHAQDHEYGTSSAGPNPLATVEVYGWPEPNRTEHKPRSDLG